MSHFDLVHGARQAMLESGFVPDIPAPAMREAEALRPASVKAPGVRDLRALPWSSIDNDESRDLDQIEVADLLPNGLVRVRVGIADVDALVAKGSALDAHAARNTCTVYTGAAIFPMLPESLSTDHTSLGEGVDRLAIVIEMDVDTAGVVASADVYRAAVRNHAKLAYDGVGAWLEGVGPAPSKVATSAVIAEQLRLQDGVAESLKKRRYDRGALDLETIEARAVVKQGTVVGIELTKASRARSLIEDFMIAANGAIALFLDGKGVSSIRRVVKAPERWQRIVALTQGFGDALPNEPSSLALAAFLERRKTAAPDTFADLSLSVVKLMGPGEYALERPGQPHDGHFGLAVTDYTHSTAPNRRFADLVTQRLVKAALAGAGVPLLRRRARRGRPALHAEGERRAQGRAHDAEAGRGALPQRARRRGVRGDRHRRHSEGGVRPAHHPSRRGAHRAKRRRGSTWATTCACASSPPSRARGSSTSSACDGEPARRRRALPRRRRSFRGRRPSRRHLHRRPLASSPASLASGRRRRLPSWGALVSVTPASGTARDPRVRGDEATRPRSTSS